MKSRSLSALAVLTSALTLLLLTAAMLPAQSQQGGNLAPGAAPGVTMKSLSQIDPGTALDPADAPFTIATAGSYYLTGNVTSVPASQAVFTISISNVTIDLRGFSLTANGGTPGNASTSAIFAAPTAEQVRVSNGVISGNWHSGVFLSNTENATCENLRIRGADQRGLSVGNGSLVTHCQVDGGAATGSGFLTFGGIYGGFRSIVRSCTVQRSDGFGITVSTGGSVLDCLTHDTIGNGISSGAGSVISRCVTSDAAVNGINAGFGTLLSDCSGFSNDGAGITAGSGCRLSNCTAYDNGGDGIDVAAGCSLAGCVAYANDADGIELNHDALVVDCSSSDNGRHGFSASVGTNTIASYDRIRYSDCLASGNTGHGFEGDDDCSFSGCLAQGNGIDGFQSGLSAVIESCTASNNTDDGFDSGRSANLRGCAARGNTDRGFNPANGSSIVGCTAESNGLGYSAILGTTVSQCSAASNTNSGFNVTTGCFVSQCTSYDNGQATSNASADGFSVGAGALIINCVAYNNEGNGIDGASGNAMILQNLCYANSGGGIGGSTANVLRGNFSDANTGSNYPAQVNEVGPVEDAATGTNPNANFD